MTANRMEGECLVMCSECNSYLWSEDEHSNNGEPYKVIECPYQKKPGTNECTGVPKSRKKELA